MEHSRVANSEKVKITFWRLSLRENSNVSLILAGNSKCLFLRQVGSDGEERDFEDLLAHLAARIKLRFGRVCYRLDIRLQCIPLIRGPIRLLFRNLGRIFGSVFGSVFSL